jgi:predicted metalloprotease
MTKRQKLIKEMIDLTYNSASSIRNYIMNDPVLDYIKVVINPPEIKKEETFLKFIMKRGEDFEKDIVGKIEKIVIDSGEKFVKVTNNKEDINLKKL